MVGTVDFSGECLEPRWWNGEGNQLRVWVPGFERREGDGVIKVRSVHSVHESSDLISKSSIPFLPLGRQRPLISGIAVRRSANHTTTGDAIARWSL
ncbi:hypothetical protein CDAR_52231 [Caerostris darwini]|uniref:Uncharacterized protein n=1 Tax=Caerostris darwini TaxID=1538125 RepID=A0AAV4V3D0_9ARAC|nr:hypothetical protein CDAR_52231 [Caerostris darwini]